MYEHSPVRARKAITIRDIISTHPDRTILEDLSFESLHGWADLELYQYPSDEWCKEENTKPHFFVCLWGVGVKIPEVHQYLLRGFAYRKLEKINQRLEKEGFKFRHSVYNYRKEENKR